jgi:hypothetical protein
MQQVKKFTVRLGITWPIGEIAITRASGDNGDELNVVSHPGGAPGSISQRRKRRGMREATRIR